MRKKKLLSNEEFLRHVRDYLPMDAAVWNTDERGQPCSGPISGGTDENRFYLFDAEAVLSASHAIEEMALEEARGSLLATMQDFKWFEPHRERYWQLAATLDRVRVVARGRRRASHNRLEFVAGSHPAIAPFWTVLYEGGSFCAMLICRESDGAVVFNDKRFLGFYTFDSTLIARVRRDIEQILAGTSSRMTEFERLVGIDRAAKQANALFERERKLVEAALRRLQTGGRRYQPLDFAADLEKSLTRLNQMNAKLSELMQRGGQSLVA